MDIYWMAGHTSERQFYRFAGRQAEGVHTDDSGKGQIQ